MSQTQESKQKRKREDDEEDVSSSASKKEIENGKNEPTPEKPLSTILPPLPTDLNALLQNLAASKAALQEQLEKQKKETQQALLLNKSIKRKKLDQQVKEDKKDEKKEIKREEREAEKKEDSESKEKEREKYKEKEREKERERDKDKDREKDRDRREKRDREKERERDRDRDRKERDRDREKERDRRDRDKDRDRRDRDKDRDRRDKERDRERDREREKGKDRDRDRYKEKERYRDKETRDRREKEKEKEKEKPQPPPLLVDDKGRELDASGHILTKIQINPVTTLKANQKFKVKQKLLDLTPLPSETKKSIYFDPTLVTPKPERQRRALNFLEAGTIIKKAEKIRQKQTAPEESKDIIEQKGEEKKLKKPVEPIPDVEWWDKYLLLDGVYTNNIDKWNWNEVTIYIEHPIPVKPPSEKDEPPPLPMFLTKKEQKRLRKINRMEREKEKQEKILLGLEPPPKPKVKISNLMRVLGAEATSDPTQIEQEVKRQIAERVANHEARNQARKLTKEQKKEKKKTKLLGDLKNGTHALLFKIKDFSDPRHKFKVDINARELQLTGCALFYKDINMILVEGGGKAIRKFKKLMTKRIDWGKTVKVEAPAAKVEGEENPSTEITKTEEPMEEDKALENGNSDSSVKKSNNCFLVWQGTIAKPNFQQFKFETFASEDQIRKYLNNRWSEHYWDMILNYREELKEDIM